MEDNKKKLHISYRVVTFWLQRWIDFLSSFRQNKLKRVLGENMHTITVNVDDNYFEQVINYLQKIPKSKREIFQHTKIESSPAETIKNDDDFLVILKNGPTISEKEAKELENDIGQGWKNWRIEGF